MTARTPLHVQASVDGRFELLRRPSGHYEVVVGRESPDEVLSTGPLELRLSAHEFNANGTAHRFRYRVLNDSLEVLSSPEFQVPRELLVRGFQDAVEAELLQFRRQVLTVTSVCGTVLAIAALFGEVSPALPLGVMILGFLADLAKTSLTRSELAHIQNDGTSSSSTSRD